MDPYQTNNEEIEDDDGERSKTTYESCSSPEENDEQDNEIKIKL